MINITEQFIKEIENKSFGIYYDKVHVINTREAIDILQRFEIALRNEIEKEENDNS